MDGRGLATATFFGLVFAAGHLTQEVRDHDGDGVNGIRTNAVTFGKGPTFAASLVLFTLAHGLLLLLAFRGALPLRMAALVAVYPVQLYCSLASLREGLTYATVSRLQTRYRALYAVVGLGMIAVLFAGSHFLSTAR